MPKSSASSTSLALMAAAAASSSSVHHAANEPLTLTVLGCGTMGIAILSGILRSLEELQVPRPLQVMVSNPAASATASAASGTRPSSPGSTSPAMDEMPARLPGRFIACVRRPESAKRVKAALWAHSSVVTVVQNDNLTAARQADVVLLACKPEMAREILSFPGMVRALHGKLLISICAGVTVEQLEGFLHGHGAGTGPAVPLTLTLDPDVDGRCRIVRAMPNTASLIGESMTVIATAPPPLPPLPPATVSLVTWIFRRVGDVVFLPPHMMDACTALCAAGPAFFALMLEAAIDGAVAMGLPRTEAQRMAAQTMRGVSGLVLHGDHPALLRDNVSTPGGSAIHGCMVLEEGRVRSTVARAVQEAAMVAGQLGKGMPGAGSRTQ